MGRKIFIVGFLFALGLFLGCQPENKDIRYERKYAKEIKEIRKEIYFYLSRNSIPGGNFAISIKGKTIYSEGIGFASSDLDVRATRSTKFRIGDNSCLITGLVFRNMEKKGVLNQDSTVGFYLPGFSDKLSGITLGQLVQDISGIRTPTDDELNRADYFVTLREGLDRFKNDTLAFGTGTFQEHSAYNFNLLGYIMEKTTGKKFSQVVKEYLLDTLKMDNTVEENIFAIIKGRSDYFENNVVSQVMNATTQDLRSFSPSLGYLSNAEDLLKLGNAMLYSGVIPGRWKEYLKLPRINGELPAQLANGWVVSVDGEGRSFFGKAGYVRGGGSALLVFPGEEIVVAAAVNLSTRMDDIPVFDYASKFMKSKKTAINPENTKTE